MILSDSVLKFVILSEVQFGPGVAFWSRGNILSILGPLKFVILSDSVLIFVILTEVH